MISSLTLKNFRCFENHTIEFPLKSLLVGKNNAGKSTCVEGLRLVSIVTERLANLTWRYPPPQGGIPVSSKGASPSIDSISIHKDCLFFRYGKGPGLVSAQFGNGSRLDVYVTEDLYVHAVVYDQRGRAANSRVGALSAGIPRVSILPQIGPLLDGEERLSDDHIRRNLQTSLSSLHFRNQLRLFRDQYFASFKDAVEATWPGLRIDSLDLPSPFEKNGKIILMVRDGDFSAEVAWMGHGVQMWLQTMWFLCRNTNSGVLILDEPDVYMHADLQRRLVRMLSNDTRQFIIATHSPEMLAEVEADSVVVLNRQATRSRPATSSRAVQELLDRVGSVHNLSLARLAIHRKILFVEGDDVALLKRFQNVIDPKWPKPIDTIPNTDVQGWSGWPAVLTFARFLRENAHNEFMVFCVMDRDYHTDDEITERKKQAKAAGIGLHIWEAKELENYVIEANAIARLISKRLKNTTVTPAEVDEAIEAAVEARKEESFDAFSETIRQLSRTGADKSNAAARPIFNKRWQSARGRQVVGGKQLVADVGTWSQNKYGISISIAAVLREMTSMEVASEVRDVITTLTT
jgi:hypothetical protein